MDSMDLSAATSAGDKKQRFRKKGRNRRRRLHLRKTAVQPPTMQSEDKCGQKKIAEVWPSSKKTSQEAQHSQHGTNNSEKTLRFTCSQCSDNLEYVPKDLVAHFEDNHRGSLPVFSCHTCTFKTHEFSYLQIHLLSHMDTFSCCSICSDDVQRTWPEFSAHLTLCHCQNGKYSCQMCQRFSTGDVKVFLEHIYAHNLSLEGVSSDLSLRTKDKNQFGPKPSTLRCQHCGYEASQKWLITKHIKAVHVCQNGNQRQRKKEEVHSIAMKQKDPIPKMKPRLTRSAVKEMCWLTQDCLSLPGREFLDKYCHLSDPQTTLEETQQFLMKSVARETGDQKWTKALKSVLSNVPQDVTLHPKSENGIMSNSADLTVLTVKNKITVAQNGAAYAKRMRRMTASDKETGFPESAADDARCAVDQNGCQSNLNDCPPCPQTESKLHNDVSVSAQNEASGCTQMQENRENQELETAPKMEEHGRKQQEPMHEDVINISSELKSTNESVEPTSISKVLPKNKRRNRRRKRRSKKVYKRPSGLPLKIVLKKNPVKEKQWVSQSSLSPSGGDPMEDNHGLPTPHITTEMTAQILSEKKWTRASRTDLREPAEATTSDPQSKSGEELSPGCAAQPMGSINMDVNEPGVLVSSLSMHHEMQDDPEESLHFPETDVDVRSSAGKSGAVAEAEVEMCPKNSPLQTSGSSVERHEPDEKTISAADGETQSSCTKSSPVSQPAITPQGEVNLEDSSPALPSEHSNHSAEGGGGQRSACRLLPRSPVQHSLAGGESHPTTALTSLWAPVSSGP
ncbi:uncharacterized protein LOC128453150 [Pleuronectes platessa]|uniref:uncharacterized protein LOC128453150 n=1 Tax=Pleuronectes platessa TaxID=8262 RepID=UPI00232A5608|nr:uncharacterized protein LOC128453150 [Pleuronectes platessa]